MRKGILIGIAFFLGFAIYQAPAGLLRIALDDQAVITLTDLEGTLWLGRARVVAQGNELARLHWDLNNRALLTASLSYQLRIDGADLDLTGELDMGIGTSALQFTGRLGSAEINRRLALYDIALEGDFDIRAAQIRLSGNRPVAADGEIHWVGGPVRYVLSGRASSSMLPPLTAYLGPGPEAVVFPAEGQTPLLTARLLENGYAKVGVTKFFTRMLGSPWPGGDPDHAVVLEVEEQLF